MVCSQIGAREHYAVPRAFSKLNLLDTLVTDVWVSKSLRALLTRIPSGKRLGTKGHADISDDRVVAFRTRAILTEAANRLRTHSTTEDRYYNFLRVGQRFAGDTRAFLEARVKSKAAPAAFFSYSTGALEAVEFLEGIGVPTLVDQIDPARAVDEIVRRESALWPDWMDAPGRIPEVYFQRLEAEWAKATRVVVNSEWSRKALLKQAVPPGKIVTLPLAYDLPTFVDAPRPRNDGVTVLWVGQVSLLKGIQYLIQAAKQLQSERIQFLIAGAVGIRTEAVRSAPSKMTFIGSVPRDKVSSLYRSADLFVFPTLSDGFGITQLEAMAHGVPVIATSNCGDVVTDGLDGRIIPAGDSNALAEAIMELASNTKRLRAMSAAAIQTSKRFSVDILAQRLRTILDDLN